MQITSVTISSVSAIAPWAHWESVFHSPWRLVHLGEAVVCALRVLDTFPFANLSPGVTATLSSASCLAVEATGGSFSFGVSFAHVIVWLTRTPIGSLTWAHVANGAPGTASRRNGEPQLGPFWFTFWFTFWFLIPFPEFLFSDRVTFQTTNQCVNQHEECQ